MSLLQIGVLTRQYQVAILNAQRLALRERSAIFSLASLNRFVSAALVSFLLINGEAFADDYKTITAIAAGGTHSIALDDSNGKVYATGSYGYDWPVNDSVSETKRAVFTEVSSLSGKNITAIAAGGEHSLVTDGDGKIYATGNNFEGQLGLVNSGGENNRYEFEEVEF